MQSQPRTGQVVYVTYYQEEAVNTEGVYLKGMVFFYWKDLWILVPENTLRFLPIPGYMAPCHHGPRGIVYGLPGRQGYAAIRTEGQTWTGLGLTYAEKWVA